MYSLTSRINFAFVLDAILCVGRKWHEKQNPVPAGCFWVVLGIPGERATASTNEASKPQEYSDSGRRGQAAALQDSSHHLWNIPRANWQLHVWRALGRCAHQPQLRGEPVVGAPHCGDD